jgi:CheY-like chemotaxis protein
MAIDRPILIVEDEPYDAEIVKQSLRTAGLKNEVLIFHDGGDAIHHLQALCAGQRYSSEFPAVVMLDLTLKRMRGIEVLSFIRSQKALAKVPVVVFTASQDDPQIEEAYEAGSNAYVIKPDSPAKFVETVKRIGTFWAKLNEPIPA